MQKIQDTYRSNSLVEQFTLLLQDISGRKGSWCIACIYDS